MAEMTGGEAIVHMLQILGIDHAFGMGGFQPLPYYDALARQDRIRHVLIRDEKHGAFAADAFARVANRPAVADATLGPGATNLVSGAAESLNASIPLILLTGEVNSLIAGRGATQESDQVGMLSPTCKASIRIERIERIPELLRRAISVATGGRAGPVHVNVPEDVFHGRHDFAETDLYSDPGSCRVAGRRSAPDPALIDRAAALLSGAIRPVVIAGGGIHLSEAHGSLFEFATAAGIPVATTISGKGAFPEDHPLSLGICGRFSRFANDMIKAADVLLVVGSKLGEIATNRWTLLPASTPLIHIDVDPNEIGKVHQTAVGVVADAKLALSALIQSLPGNSAVSRAWQDALSSVRDAWRVSADVGATSSEQPVHMARVIHEIQGVSGPDTILVADGGFAAHWSGLLYDVTHPGRGYIANRGHAAVGYALPGAIGAKLARPDSQVIALCGDNGFAMAAAELETAKRVGAPVVVVVVNNMTLGYVKALQQSLYSGRFLSVDFLDVHYDEVARAFGCEGRRIADPDSLGPALADACSAEVPYLLDVLITTDPRQMLPGVDARTVSALA